MIDEGEATDDQVANVVALEQLQEVLAGVVEPRAFQKLGEQGSHGFRVFQVWPPGRKAKKKGWATT